MLYRRPRAFGGYTIGGATTTVNNATEESCRGQPDSASKAMGSDALGKGLMRAPDKPSPDAPEGAGAATRRQTAEAGRALDGGAGEACSSTSHRVEDREGPPKRAIQRRHR